jgi:putative nucleotidyltransferase with HDIG domain
MQSVKTFEEKEQLFLGILMALTRAIDAKSRWTAGHSERVARYAEAIGRSLGLAEEELRSLSIAAILHDIGKLAVPESILDKPARLDEQEYAVIRTHPETGVRILGDIPAYRDIVPGVLHHHEHWNGGGYPGGLRGTQIPLQSRIICLADVYDAITADRPYRSGMSQAEARTFIESMSGVMFDPALVGELWRVVELEQQQNLPSMIDFEHNLF